MSFTVKSLGGICPGKPFAGEPFDDGKRFLKRWELVYEVVGGGCGGGFGGGCGGGCGGGGNLVPGDLQVWSAEKYSQKMGAFFGALSATARLVFCVSLCAFSRFFVDAAYHV